MTELTSASVSKIKQIILSIQKGQVHIFFGSDEFSKAPFEAAAWYLHKKLKRIYINSKIIVNAPEKIESSAKLVKFLLKERAAETDKIKELHVFSHSWPSGLSLNYGGNASDQDLKRVGRNIWKFG